MLLTRFLVCFELLQAFVTCCTKLGKRKKQEVRIARESNRGSGAAVPSLLSGDHLLSFEEFLSF